MAGLRAFAESAELLDTIGAEAIARSKSGGENLLLVDRRHAVPAAATLLGGRLYANGPCRVRFCLLRPQGDKLVAVWVSAPCNVTEPGPARFTFQVPVAARAGDVIGLDCPGAVQVPYDAGTGDTRTGRAGVEVGQVLGERDLTGGDHRAYAFGVLGFVEGEE